MPKTSSDLPESRPGRPVAFYLVLLRMGFTQPARHRDSGSLLHCHSTITTDFRFYGSPWLFIFCCTGLGVASTGCYPASCPVKPGLSSPVPFRLYSRDHLFYLFFFPIHSRRFLAWQQQHCLSDLCCLHIKTASAHKLPAQRIFRQFLTADSQEIFQEF